MSLNDPDYVETLVEQMQAIGMSDEEIAEALNEIAESIEEESK